MNLLLDVLLLLTAWVHVVLTPYTKVEESFNLHATHDVLMYGLSKSSLSKYDHFVFPGAVPRSFLGSIVLAYISVPIIRFFDSFGFVESKADVQTIVRLVLATLNALALCTLRRAVSKRFGNSTGTFFALLSCTQFHLPFWMGRTLPNMFALFPVVLSYSCMCTRRPDSLRPPSKNVSKAISLLVFTTAVFRAEVALLLAPLVLWTLLAGWMTLTDVFKTGVEAGIISLLLTTSLDSYLWRRWPLWPELYSIYFNVYQNKSVEWGVLPFHSYCTSFLPKLLLSSFPLSMIGFLVDRQVRGWMLWMLSFVLGMSMLGHKEWRFVVYAVPAINIVAARGAYWLIGRRRFLGRMGRLFLYACIAANVLVTVVMVHVSMANYPGGVTLTRFNEIMNGTQDVHVHISNLAAQTGASLFQQVHATPFLTPGINLAPSSDTWIYNKTENLSSRDITHARHFTHAIVETEQLDGFIRLGWTKVECVQGFDGFRVQRGILSGKESRERIWDSLPKLNVRYADKLCILSR